MPTKNFPSEVNEDRGHPEKPRSWLRWYGIVLGELAVLIVFFYLFTKAFE